MRDAMKFAVGLGLCAMLTAAGATMAEDAPTPGDADWRPTPAQTPDDGKLRIIVFGGHPDDAEIRAGGIGALWAEQGHHVKFVSLTNGDIGHWRMAGGALAQRRIAEVEKAAEELGIAEVEKAAEELGIAEVEVLDIHDGELMPTLENRHTVVGLIREWMADIVIVHRPNDYHPDHRNAGLLVRDAAYMVTVPFYRPDVPYLENNPVFLYAWDRIEKPNPHEADIVVDIGSVVERKVEALTLMESQFVEGGCCGAQRDPEGAERERVREQVREGFRNRFSDWAERNRDRLIELYGEDRGRAVQYAEAFEIAEHGSRPDEARLRELFPFEGLWEE